MSAFWKYQHRAGQLMMPKDLISICPMMFRFPFRKEFIHRQSGSRQLKNNGVQNNFFDYLRQSRLTSA